MYNRQGKIARTVGERALHNTPIPFSPDRTRVAAVKRDIEAGTTDLWVFDVATGASTRITFKETRGARTPAWSPDGSQAAYVGLREGSFGLYRKASNGEGTEELLYQHSDEPILTGWSVDGRFLNFRTSQPGGNSLYVLPLSGHRKPMEMLRSEFQLPRGTLSPDSGFLLYRSNESGKEEIYVRSFDPSGGATDAARKWRVAEGGQGGGCCGGRMAGNSTMRTPIKK